MFGQYSLAGLDQKLQRRSKFSNEAWKQTLTKWFGAKEFLPTYVKDNS